jgi:hypothetical protein
MKRIAAFISLVFSFAAVVPAYAQPLCPPGAFSNLCNLKPSNAGGIASTVVEVLIIIGIIMSLFYLILGGIRYTSSGGDKAKVDSARSTIIAAIVGLVITVSAFFIMNLVLYFFTGKGLTNMAIPTLLQ